LRFFVGSLFSLTGQKPSVLLSLVLRLTLPSTRGMDGSEAAVGKEMTVAALFFRPLVTGGLG